MIGALELGGSHVSAARVDVETACVTGLVRTALAPEASREELVARIVSTVRAGASGARSLGVATPGPFDYARGISLVRGLGKLESLYAVDLRRELVQALPGLDETAVRFVNDAEAFVLGEALAGAARGHRRVVGITLGTGLGSAFLAEGEIVRTGPEVPPDGSLHLVPFRGGHVEDAISGRALRAKHPGGAPAEQLADTARAGDAEARRAYRELGTDLAEALGPWVRAFGPTCVVVGGSIALAWDLFGDALEQGLGASTLDVTRAARLEDAALVGAAVVASLG